MCLKLEIRIKGVIQIPQEKVVFDERFDKRQKGYIVYVFREGIPPVVVVVG